MSPYIRLMGATSLVAGLAAVAFGGPVYHPIFKTVVVKNGEKLPVAYPVTMNTDDFYPQISKVVERMHTEVENPYPVLPSIPPIPGNYPKMGNADGATSSTVNALFPGVNQNGWVPADPTIAVGPNDVVESTNDTIGIFSKTGTLEVSQQFSTFYSGLGAGSFIYDPKSVYDPISKRFFVIALELDTANNISKILLAVSQTSSATGGWNKYRIQAGANINGTNCWMDYPSLSISTNGVVVSGNMFPISTGNYGGAEFVCINKADVVAGNPTSGTLLHDTGGGTARMAVNHDSTQSSIYGLARQSNTTIRAYNVSNIPTSPSLAMIDVPVPSAQGSGQGALSLGGHLLDTIGDRLFNVSEANGHLVTGHDIEQLSGNRARTNVRWYQFNINSWPASGQPTVNQYGQIDTGPDDETLMPALDENAAGDVSCIFTRSSSTISTDIMIASRKKTDPLGTLGTPKKIGGSANAYGGSGDNRWGDYFEVAVDPNDLLTFWGVAMRANTDGSWTTDIDSWMVSTSINLPKDYHATTASMYEGISYTGTAASLNAIDGDTFSIHSRSQKSLGQLASVLATYQLDSTNLAAMTVRVAASASRGTTEIVFAYNFVTKQYDVIGQSPTIPTYRELSFAIAHPNNYVDSTGKVQIVCRGIFPQRFGGAALPIVVNYDEVVVNAASN